MESENNPSHDPGLVTVFRLAGGGTDEMEVVMVQQLLESNGIDTVLVGDNPCPAWPKKSASPKKTPSAPNN